MSIDYYNENAEDFIKRTFNLDVSTIADRFLDLVVDKGRILDLGCGSGRDALYFQNKGYDVYAMDGSDALVAYAKESLGDRVTCATFQDYTTTLTFDGIWAMASLLHVADDQLVALISKYTGMLNEGGIFFLSFKCYKENFSEGGRNFTCFEEGSLRNLLSQVDGLAIVTISRTQSLKAGHADESWVQALCQKKRVIS